VVSCFNGGEHKNSNVIKQDYWVHIQMAVVGEELTNINGDCHWLVRQDMNVNKHENIQLKLSHN
jgi:hypothetical protein